MTDEPRKITDPLESIPTEGDVKFTVWAKAYASGWLDVTLTQEELNDLLAEDGTYDADLVREAVENRAFEDVGFPGLCAACTGWGHRGAGIELNDWEPENSIETRVVLKKS